MNNNFKGKKGSMYGKHHSEEARMKIGAASRNRVFSEETKKKMSMAQRGNKHKRWKGDDVGYKPLHTWVRRYFPKPDICPECNERPPYDLANITGVYNRDFSNWKYMCRKCHMDSDGRLYYIRIQRHNGIQ